MKLAALSEGPQGPQSFVCAYGRLLSYPYGWLRYFFFEDFFVPPEDFFVPPLPAFLDPPLEPPEDFFAAFLVAIGCSCSFLVGYLTTRYCV